MKILAIFASGNGTNAGQIISHFNQHPSIRVAVVVASRPDAGVVGRAKNLGIPVEIANRQDLADPARMGRLLEQYHVSHIALAGFLLQIPAWLLERFPGRIVNLHPSLLPKYGGKGMYGSHVHEAVLANGETESGITIHLIDEEYDRGRILFQAHCPVLPGDTPDTLALRIHALEHRHYPEVIGHWLDEGE